MGLPSPTTARIKSRPVNFPLPSKLKKFLNTIVEDLLSTRLRSGTNTSMRQFSDGTEVSALIPKVQLPNDEFPFKVIRVTKDGAEKIGVISNSHLFNSEDRTVYEEPNDDWGLLSDDESTGSFDCPDLGGKIWLELELADDQSILSIDVVAAEAWEGYPDPIEINQDDPDNPYQIHWRQIIAEITDPDEDPRPGFTVGSGESRRQVTQLLFGDIQMTTGRTTRDADQPAIPLLVAVQVPWLPGTADDGSADEIPPDDGLITPWQFGTPEAENNYDFEMVDASNIDDGAQVLIYDGIVLTPNSDDVINPDGMPSDNTYLLPVDDEDEVWLEIIWDLEEDDGVSGDNVVSIDINHGPNTPDDDGLAQYITIGHVSVDDSGDVPIVSCFNELCGDVYIPYPPDLTDGIDQHKLVVDKDTGNVVWKADIPDPPDSGKYVLVSEDGNISWVEGTDCS